MVYVTIPDENRAISAEREIHDYLKRIGIGYEKWDIEKVPSHASQEQVLETYAGEIERLKEKGGYTTADVIDIDSETPGIDDMLAKFRKEHWHDEDEVRFTISGRGLFHIHPFNGPVAVIEVSAGDLIRVPRNTHHWFDLCDDRHITAIRLFQNKSGWTPYYTNTGIDGKYQPVCMGPAYFKSH